MMYKNMLLTSVSLAQPEDFAADLVPSNGNTPMEQAPRGIGVDDGLGQTVDVLFVDGRPASDKRGDSNVELSCLM